MSAHETLLVGWEEEKEAGSKQRRGCGAWARTSSRPVDERERERQRQRARQREKGSPSVSVLMGGDGDKMRAGPAISTATRPYQGKKQRSTR